MYKQVLRARRALLYPHAESRVLPRHVSGHRAVRLYLAHKATSYITLRTIHNTPPVQKPPTRPMRRLERAKNTTRAQNKV